MLRKFNETSGGETSPFVAGAPVYVVMRDGTIRQGYRIASCLMDLVSLDRSPLDDSEKQGFTIKDNQLLPNWCEGKRQILAACVSQEQAEQLAEGAQKRVGTSRPSRRPHKSCEN